MANTKKEKELVDISKVKEELTDYVNIQIQKNFSEELERANKRLIREKNRKIFAKNIVILILLGIILFLLYLLYDNRYFDKYFNSNVPIIETNDNEKESSRVSEEVEKEELSLKDLINEYGYLVDKIIINEESNYINDFYEGKLTNELKNYLTLNIMEFDKLFIEDDYNIIDEGEFKKNYNEIFKEKYESNSFDYNGTKIRYIQKLESYISDSILDKVLSNIKREIIDIEVKDKTVIITTIEGIVKDNKLYNVLTSKEIKAYKKDSLYNYESKLNKVVYTFEDSKLVSIN